MEVQHDASRQEFYVELEGHRAHVAYQIHDAIATCSYAVVWLQRHPEYQGEVSSDYIGKGSCAL